MDRDSRFGLQLLAICAALVLIVFMAVGFVVVTGALWLLGATPDGAMPPGGLLTGPLSMIAVAGVGAIGACAFLFYASRKWARESYERRRRLATVEVERR